MAVHRVAEWSRFRARRGDGGERIVQAVRASHVNDHRELPGVSAELSLIVVWAASEPIFGFPETWQRVISTTTGPLSRDQRLWLAVLHAGPRSMLGGLTAAEVHGLRRWERDVVTVLVDDELDFEPVDGVRFFRSRRSWSCCMTPEQHARRASSSRRSSCGLPTTRPRARRTPSSPPRSSSA